MRLNRKELNMNNDTFSEDNWLFPEGYTGLRFGIGEHINDRRFVGYDFGIYCYLHIRARWATGICYTNAVAIAGELTIPLTSVQESLQRMRERKYINYSKGDGSRGLYTVLIHKARPTVGVLYGYELDAFSGSDRRPPAIDPRHNPFCNRNRIGDGGLKRRRRASVPVRQFSDREDTSGDQKNTLATFVHGHSLASSPFVRHQQPTPMHVGENRGYSEPQCLQTTSPRWSQRRCAVTRLLTPPEALWNRKPLPAGSVTSLVSLSMTTTVRHTRNTCERLQMLPGNRIEIELLSRSSWILFGGKTGTCCQR